MIILITGASHTGKTALAQRLLEKYNYPYLSIDHLKMGLIRSGNTELTPLSDDNELTAYLWSIVREMIKTAIENELMDLKNKNQIKGFVNGNELDIFNLKYQTLKNKELIPKEAFNRKNPGEILVIL